MALTCSAGVAQTQSLPGDPARTDYAQAVKMPAMTKPVMFNKPEADAICGTLKVFPPDNPWNLIVDDWLKRGFDISGFSPEVVVPPR
ncbi:MAG: hypothetical protein WCL16_08665 [bacterium]